MKRASASLRQSPVASDSSEAVSVSEEGDAAVVPPEALVGVGREGFVVDRGSKKELAP